MFDVNALQHACLTFVYFAQDMSRKGMIYKIGNYKKIETDSKQKIFCYHKLAPPSFLSGARQSRKLA